MSYYQTNPRRLPLLGHLSFGVKSMAACEPFYTAVLAAFGITQVYRDAPSASTPSGPATVCGWGYGGLEPFTLFESAEVCRPSFPLCLTGESDMSFS